jgi:hypothetical protein
MKTVSIAPLPQIAVCFAGTFATTAIGRLDGLGMTSTGSMSGSGSCVTTSSATRNWPRSAYAFARPLPDTPSRGTRSRR